MPNAQTVEALMKDLESERVERTVSTDKTDKFAQAVCAFANDMSGSGQPGYLLVGVTDEGTASGLRVSDQLLQNLAALRSDGNIQPLPVIAVERVTLDGGEIAVVTVQPADLPPVRYKGQVWIRVGPRRAIASEQEERILSERRVSAAKTFDALPCLSATIEDLSLTRFAAYRERVVDNTIIQENHRTIEEQLASLRFYDLRRRSPTYGGILHLGKRVRYFLPCAYVQFLLIPDTQLVDRPIDQAEISGDIEQVIRDLEMRARAHITTALVPLAGFQEELQPDYPEYAIREILYNAVMHRDYELQAPIRFYWFRDRIEISSPGGLYGHTCPQTLMSLNTYRNPVVAESMRALGFVNRYGYGIQRAQELLRRNGNSPAEFDISPGLFKVTIRARLRQ